MESDRFKGKLKYYLRRSGYTQKEFAAELFVEPSTLSKWINGRVPWPDDALTRACELLELNENESQELFALANEITVSLASEKQVTSSNLKKTTLFPAAAQNDLEQNSRPRWVTFSVIGLILAGVVIIGVLLMIRSVTVFAFMQNVFQTQQTICGETARYEKTPGEFIRSQGITSFTSQNTSGAVLNNTVRALALTEQGLWIGYFDFENQQQPVNGLGFYNKEHWFDCDHSGATAGNINAVAIDENKHVWAVTEKDGVIMFDRQQWHRFTMADGLPIDWGYGLTIDAEDNKWIPTWQGIALFDGKNWVIPYSLKNKKLAHNDVHSVAFDNAGNTWIGYINDRDEDEVIAAVTQIRDGGDTVLHYQAEPGGLGGNQIRSIKVRQATDNTSEFVWFATADGGVSKFEGGVWTAYTVEDGLPSNNVQAVAFDKYNRVWVATIDDEINSGGVAYFNGEAWVTYHTFPAFSIAFGPSNCSTCSYDDEHVWTGTDGFGLTHSRIPYPDNAVDIIEVCFTTDEYGRVCPPLTSTKIKGTEVISATYPYSVAPDEKLYFEVTVSPQLPYELIFDENKKRGDFLSNIDKDDANLFGTHKVIATRGTFRSGDLVTFTDPNKPLIPPQLAKNEQEKTFTSRWRIWMHTRYAGPEIHINFTVRDLQ